MSSEHMFDQSGHHWLCCSLSCAQGYEERGCVVNRLQAGINGKLLVVLQDMVETCRTSRSSIVYVSYEVISLRQERLIRLYGTM